MQPDLPSDGTAPAPDLRDLNGKVVLVKSSRDHRKPPTALRGWIEVRENPYLTPEVSLVIDYPQMFTSNAHRRTIPLDQAALQRLRASETNGTFEFTIDDELR